MTRALALLLLLACLPAVLRAQGKVEYLTEPDGSLALWLEGAPDMVARQAGGWAVSPAEAPQHPKWKAALKSIGSGSWADLLTKLAAGQPVQGTRQVKPVGHLYVRLREDPNQVRVTVTNRADSMASATFENAGGMWESKDKALLEAWMLHEAHSQAAALERGLGGGDTPWSTFLTQATSKTPQRMIRLPGTGSAFEVSAVPDAGFLPAPATQASTKPAGAAPSEPPAASPWPTILFAFGGLGLGFGAAFLPPVRRVMARRSSEPDSPTRSFGLPEDATLAEALRREHREQLNLGLTDCEDPSGWLRDTMQKGLSDRNRLISLQDDHTKLQSAFTQTRDSAFEYRKQHGEWVRDRDSTLAKLERARKDYQDQSAQLAELNALIQKERTANNAEQESMRQRIDALTKDVAVRQSRAEELARRAVAYSELHAQANEAFRLVQSEIGRVDVAAVVGYMLSYSLAGLMDTLLAPNPAMEAAMLSNVEMIASNVSGMAQCIRLANSARSLREESGLPAIVPSAEASPDARNMSGLLRFLRDQKRMQLSPFYSGVDSQGHVYVVSL